MNPTYARKHDGYLKNYQKTGIKSIIGRGREVPIIVKAGHEVKVCYCLMRLFKDTLSCFMNSLNYNGNIIENLVNSLNMTGILKSHDSDLNSLIPLYHL
jgi:hypothetical protein